MSAYNRSVIETFPVAELKVPEFGTVIEKLTTWSLKSQCAQELAPRQSAADVVPDRWSPLLTQQKTSEAENQMIPPNVYRFILDACASHVFGSTLCFSSVEKLRVSQPRTR